MEVPFFWNLAPNYDVTLRPVFTTKQGVLAQADFRSNPRSTFNLHLTADKRRRLRSIGDASRLGDYFEVHEGIHSGNIRTELFVDSAVDYELVCFEGKLSGYTVTVGVGDFPTEGDLATVRVSVGNGDVCLTLLGKLMDRKP